MKLERIHVERFGAWQNLELPVDADGLSVFFGPNEAGKTTLMRFVRGMLYGFDADDLRRLKGGDANGTWGGAIQIQHKNESWLVRRTGKTGTRGIATACRVSREGTGPVMDGAPLIQDIIGNVTEQIYENVFAIGLPELQALASLESDAIAEHIYSVSMGHEGRRLLKLIDETQQQRDVLLDLKRGTGTLTEKYSYLEALDRQLEGGHETRRRHGKLGDERHRLENLIVDQKDRERGLEEQLRGHEYMDFVYEPWRKVRQLGVELAKLPSSGDFPRNGLATLEQINKELGALRSRRLALLADANAVRTKRSQIEIDPNLRRYSHTLQSLVDQREWIAEVIQFAQDAVKQATQQREQLDQKLKALSGDWNIERLRGLDVGHFATGCLQERGREFTRAEQHNRFVRRRYKKLHARCHRRQQLVIERKSQLGVDSIASGFLKTQEQLVLVKELSQLRVRHAELHEHKARIVEQLNRLSVDPALPAWVSVVFSALAVVGGVIGIGGLSMGLQTNFIAGMGYVMLGLVCEGLSWSLKKHFEGQVSQAISRMRHELTGLDKRLAETDERLEEVSLVIFGPRPITPEPIVPTVPTSAAFHTLSVELPANYAEGDSRHATVSPMRLDQRFERVVTTDAAPEIVLAKFDRSMTDGELVECCHARLAQLEQLQRGEKWVDRTRQQLVAKRVRMHEAQRAFGAARQNWVGHVRSLGLTESIDVDAVLAERDALGRAAMELAQIENLVADANLGKKLFQRYRAKVEELGHIALRWKRDYSNPLVILDEWKRELAALADKLQERRKLRSAFQQQKSEAMSLWPKIRKLQSQQAALLVRGGAISMDDFQERAATIERRVSLEGQLNQARQELERVASSNQTVAIVESDLEAFDRRKNQAAIDAIRNELEDIHTDLETAAEDLKRVQQELRIVESDSTSAELRFEREQVLSSITELTEDWFALEWSLQALESLRLEFERNHQTPILTRAREFLRQLSSNRYLNIWTPLGQRGLSVDTDSGEAVLVENLSSGAQEQLFLAIRLALIEHFTQEGVELPVVLDDILVNFDLDRTRAAVDELLRVASDSQQILFFTCHQHLADLFRQRGISAVSLPSREAQERLAG